MFGSNPNTCPFRTTTACSSKKFTLSLSVSPAPSSTRSSAPSSPACSVRPERPSRSFSSDRLAR